MTADREQTRRDAPAIRTYIENAGYEVLALSDGSRTAMPMDTAPVIAELDALLAELEQAERERDEALQRVETRIEESGVYRVYDEAMERAQTAEARLESVPALVEALERVLSWPLPQGTVESYSLPQWLAKEARAALARYEQSQGKP